MFKLNYPLSFSFCKYLNTQEEAAYPQHRTTRVYTYMIRYHCPLLIANINCRFSFGGRQYIKQGREKPLQYTELLILEQSKERKHCEWFTAEHGPLPRRLAC